MKKYTIKDLAEGRVALHYNGNDLEKLREVLTKAFPNDFTNVNVLASVADHSDYYFSSETNIYCWTSDDVNRLGLPIQDLEDFDLEEPETVQVPWLQIASAVLSFIWGCIMLSVGVLSWTLIKMLACYFILTGAIDFAKTIYIYYQEQK